MDPVNEPRDRIAANYDLFDGSITVCFLTLFVVHGVCPGKLWAGR